eukprot:m.1011390 g.1011390  ORF g.1011390 m.1011390 type:complete len:697 (-) comp24062_c0_seq11:3705-5795(-)
MRECVFAFAAAMVVALLIVGSWHFSGTTDERQLVVGVLVDGEWQWQHRDGREYVHDDDDVVQATVSKEVIAMRSDSDWLVPVPGGSSTLTDRSSIVTNSDNLTKATSVGSTNNRIEESQDEPLSEELAGKLLDAGLTATCKKSSVDAKICQHPLMHCNRRGVAEACPRKCQSCGGPLPMASDDDDESISSQRTSQASLASTAALVNTQPLTERPPALGDGTTVIAPLNGRCGSRIDCEFEFPQRNAGRIASLDRLPLFANTCLFQHGNPVAAVHLLRLEASFVVGTPSECRERCVLLTRCVSWVHFARHATMKVHPPDTCMLYSTYPVNQHAFRENPAQSYCTAGLVRAGFARMEDDLPTPTSVESALEHMPAASFAKCHGLSCLDVFHCASYGPQNGKYAFVLVHDLRLPSHGTSRGKTRNFVTSSVERTRLVQAANAMQAALVMMVPADDVALFPLLPDEKQALEGLGFRVVYVPWSLPPSMKHTKPRGLRCFHQDFVRLNALRLIEYDAVVVLDSDELVNGDVLPLLKCAARNYMLTASGPMSPVNLGVWAFKPDLALLDTTLDFLRSVDYYDVKAQIGGWDWIGFRPSGGGFVGDDCGQGLLWALFYKNGERNTTTALDAVWSRSKVPRPMSYQIDRCVWNFQADRPDTCAPGFACHDVRIRHKKIRAPQPPQEDQMKGRGCFYYEPVPPLT